MNGVFLFYFIFPGKKVGLMESGDMYLIKDLPGLFIILLPVKDVPVSLTLVCSCSARCISSTVFVTEAAHSPLPSFICWFLTLCF